jgi:hypothetical protein
MLMVRSRHDSVLAEEAGFLFFRISKFTGIFWERAEANSGKPLATWHQFGTKTRRWGGYFLEWRGARSNGINNGVSIALLLGS